VILPTPLLLAIPNNVITRWAGFRMAGRL
jgi:hypothetical protein